MTSRNLPIQPGAMLGVVGGGQLGRMFVHAATQMGYRVAVLDPATDSPAAEIATQHICAAYDDERGLAELAQCCAAVTTEFENVPASSMHYLHARVPVSPPPTAIEIAQNRLAEKAFFNTHQLPTNEFAAIHTKADLTDAWPRFSSGAILKTATLGYDGKGQCVCNTLDEALLGFEQFGAVSCILEQRIVLDGELSVVLARGIDGAISAMPVAENIHSNGILDISIVPARVSSALATKALSLAGKLIAALDYIGVLAVEIFVSGDDLLLNEIAPRPHNSGHFTLDATNYSQFDQQVFTLCGLPAAKITPYTPVIMLNILGDLVLLEDFSWTELQLLAGTHVHVYGKSQARSGRKMAHVNFVGEHTKQLLAQVQAVKARWPSAFA